MRLSLLCEATYYNKDRLEVALLLHMPIKAGLIRHILNGVHSLVCQWFGRILAGAKDSMQNWETHTVGSSLRYTRHYPITRLVRINRAHHGLTIRSMPARVREPAVV